MQLSMYVRMFFDAGRKAGLQISDKAYTLQTLNAQSKTQGQHSREAGPSRGTSASAGFGAHSLAPWRAFKNPQNCLATIGALIINYTILGAPYYKYSRTGPKTLV